MIKLINLYYSIENNNHQSEELISTLYQQRIEKNKFIYNQHNNIFLQLVDFAISNHNNKDLVTKIRTAIILPGTIIEYDFLLEHKDKQNISNIIEDIKKYNSTINQSEQISPEIISIKKNMPDEEFNKLCDAQNQILKRTSIELLKQIIEVNKQEQVRQQKELTSKISKILNKISNVVNKFWNTSNQDNKEQSKKNKSDNQKQILNDLFNHQTMHIETVLNNIATEPNDIKQKIDNIVIQENNNNLKNVESNISLFHMIIANFITLLIIIAIFEINKVTKKELSKKIKLPITFILMFNILFIIFSLIQYVFGYLINDNKGL